MASTTSASISLVKYFHGSLLKGPATSWRRLILDRFCAPLCERLHSKPRSKRSEPGFEEFIEWLEEANLFVIPLDLEHRWFRYHHLFQELLQNELRRCLGHDEIVSLHERASSWFLENQMIDEAIPHSLKAGDVVGAAEIIESSADDQFRADRWHAVDRWLGMLPASLRSERPALLLIEAWISNLRYQMSRVPQILEQVESLIAGQTADPATTGKLYFFRGYFAYFEGEAESAQGHLEDSVSKLSGMKTPFLGEAELMLGLARCMGGQKQLAVQTLESGINQLDKSEGQLLSRLIASLVFIYLIDGNLPRARIESERLQVVAKNFDMHNTEAWSSYMWGCTYLHAGEFEPASHHFDRAVELRYVLEPMAAFDALAGLAADEAVHAAGRRSSGDGEPDARLRQGDQRASVLVAHSILPGPAGPIAGRRHGGDQVGAFFHRDTNAGRAVHVVGSARYQPGKSAGRARLYGKPGGSY